jgi:transcriptional regulator with XRE-family HTH domain
VAASASPTVRRRRLAAELRRLRGPHRTGGAVAKALGWSTAKISRYELGQSNFPLDEVAKLLEYYEVPEPRRGQLLTLAEDANQRGWWEEYADALPPAYLELIGLEAEAESALHWAVSGIPGLLQTERYAREVHLSYQNAVVPIPPGLVDRRVRVRLIRQEVLTKRDPALELSVVLDESALLRKIGGPEIMSEQLARLLTVSELPNVELRILPLDSGGSPPPVSFLVFGFRAGGAEEASLGDVVSLEGLTDNIQVEGETDTYVYRLLFRTLMESSLSPDESRHLIRTTAQQRWA